MATRGVCAIPGCDKAAYCRSWCSAHYERWRRHGDPLSGGPDQQQGRALEWLFERAGAASGDCIIWPFSRARTGYPNVIRFEGENIEAHRVMCILANGEPPAPDLEAAHSCGRGKQGCVHPGHLRWATSVENCNERRAHGTMPVGTAAGSDLTEERVLAIYARRGAAGQRTVAAEFGVGRNAVRGIWLGITWSWLTGAKPDDRYRAGRRAWRLERSRRSAKAA